MNYKFTDKEINILLNNIVYVADTNEQENDHITKWFKENKKKLIHRKLRTGDYSCFIQHNEKTKDIIDRDIWFNNEVVIERKNSINELIGNIYTDIQRFENELLRAKAGGIKFYLFLEDYLFHKHLKNETYQEYLRGNADKKKVKSETLDHRLLSLFCQYNVFFQPVHEYYIGWRIYETLRQEVKNRLKYEGFLNESDRYNF